MLQNFKSIAELHQHERSFFFMPLGIIETATLFLLVIISLFILGACTLATYFTFLVKTQNIKTATTMQRSLIISSIAQISLTCLCLFCPWLCLIVGVYFQSSKASGIFQFCYFLIVTHALLEFLATLYFVSPYRKFVGTQFLRVFPRCKPQIKITSVPPASFATTRS